MTPAPTIDITGLVAELRGLSQSLRRPGGKDSRVTKACTLAADALEASQAREAAAVKVEREACARVVDAEADITRASRPGRSVSFDRVAADIRARTALTEKIDG
jgi:hypothetical protein